LGKNGNHISGVKLPSAGAYSVCFSPDGANWCKQSVKIVAVGI
jgi:hypothetical protein